MASKQQPRTEAAIVRYERGVRFRDEHQYEALSVEPQTYSDGQDEAATIQVWFTAALRDPDLVHAVLQRIDQILKNPQDAALSGAWVPAITLWQPWASLLMAGYKTYETRSWRLGGPGWVAIHAAQSEPSDVAVRVAQPRRSFGWALRQMGVTFDDLPRGAVLGLARFDEPRPVEDVRSTLGTQDLDFGDWTDGRHAWPVVDRWLLPNPLPARGRQGLWRWNMPAGLAARFEARTGGVL